MAGESAASILVANDQEDICRIIVDRLRFRGLQVGTAEDGRTCVEMIGLHPPDLVLLDVRMPYLGGLDVLDWLEDNHPDIPVLMVSASADREVIEASLARGVVDYLLKPFNGKALERKVFQALGREIP